MRRLLLALLALALALAAPAHAQVTGLSAPLVIDAQDTLGQRNGTNAQELRVYTTFTDASNYQRLSLVGNTGTANTVGVNAASAGTGGNIGLQFGAGGAWRWQISTSGHLLALTDNSTDIGASAATRPRDVYVGRDLITNAGGSTGTFKSTGVLSVDVTTTGNTGAALQAIKSYTLPASALSANGKAVRVTGYFVTANNANAKTVGVRWCSAFATSYTTTASIAGGIKLVATLVRSASNSQIQALDVTEGLTTATLTQAKFNTVGVGSNPTCTDSSTILAELIVQGTSNNDIQSSFMMVEFLN